MIIVTPELKNIAPNLILPRDSKSAFLDNKTNKAAFWVIQIIMIMDVHPNT